MSDSVSHLSAAFARNTEVLRRAEGPPLVVGNGIKRHRYLFVDNVRFWSMFAVVLVHGMAVFGTDIEQGRWLRQALQTPLKFGTVGFFLISGFLLGERLQTSRPVEYFGRRVRKVFLPWLIWISLLSLYLTGLEVIRGRQVLTLSNAFPLLLSQAKICLLSTSFWFVPNLLMALVVLLIFRRYLYDLRLGAVLLAVQLFYIVNVYKAWIPSSHLEALFGFVFDLWLGSYASRHIDGLIRWIARVRMFLLVALSVAICLLAFGETRLLTHLHVIDPMNTLRLSNQIFSLVIVLLILKLRSATWPSFVDVRRDTFGIYLAHAMLLAMCINAVNEICRRYFAGARIMPDARGILVWICVTALGYVGSLAITRLLVSRRRLGWLVGADSPDVTTVTAPIQLWDRLNDLPIGPAHVGESASEQVPIGPAGERWAAGKGVSAI